MSMNRKILFLPLLLLAVMASAEPFVRIVGTNGSGKSFATDQVHKLVLLSDAVDVMDGQGSVLLSVPLAEIARVEFTDGTPNQETAIEATLVKDANAIKLIENNQVYILSNGRKYTIMGVEVESKE